MLDYNTIDVKYMLHVYDYIRANEVNTATNNVLMQPPYDLLYLSFIKFSGI